jgi:hypothetical protein
MPKPEISPTNRKSVNILYSMQTSANVSNLFFHFQNEVEDHTMDCKIYFIIHDHTQPNLAKIQYITTINIFISLFITLTVSKLYISVSEIIPLVN